MNRPSYIFFCREEYTSDQGVLTGVAPSAVKKSLKSASHQMTRPFMSSTEWTSLGIDRLIEEISGVIYADMRKASMVIPYDQGQISSYLCEKCKVHKMEYQNEGTYFEAELTAADYNRLEKYFV